MLRQPLKTQQLVASAARTTSSNSAVFLQDLDAASVTFKLACTAVTGTSPTLDVYIQTSIDGGTNWLDCGHFTQVTAAETHFMTIPVFQGAAMNHGALSDAGLAAGAVTGLPLMDRRVRAKWVIGGSDTPGATFSVDTILNNQSATS